MLCDHCYGLLTDVRMLNTLSNLLGRRSAASRHRRTAHRGRPCAIEAQLGEKLSRERRTSVAGRVQASGSDAATVTLYGNSAMNARISRNTSASWDRKT